MKFRINGTNWEIKEATQEQLKTIKNSRAGSGEKEDIKSLTERYYGITFTDLCIIYLDQDLPQERKRKTLLHELAHCYIVSYITHEEKNYNEEMVADIVANSHDIIKDIVDKYFEVVDEYKSKHK